MSKRVTQTARMLADIDRQIEVLQAARVVILQATTTPAAVPSVPAVRVVRAATGRVGKAPEPARPLLPVPATTEG